MFSTTTSCIFACVYNSAIETLLQIEQHHKKDIVSVVYKRASCKFFYRLRSTTTMICFLDT